VVPCEEELLESWIVLQKSFCTGDQKFCGLQRDIRVRLRGASSLRAKLIGDFDNATEIARIGDLFLLCVFAKNSWPCKFGVLQHNQVGKRTSPSLFQNTYMIR
jgi:hypothetical protein